MWYFEAVDMVFKMLPNKWHCIPVSLGKRPQVLKLSQPCNTILQVGSSD